MMAEQATLTITMTPDEGWAIQFQDAWWAVEKMCAPSNTRSVQYDLTRLPDDFTLKRLPDRIRQVTVLEYDDPQSKATEPKGEQR